jgi:uncharacterized protein (TIGR02722 family)
MEKMYKWSLLLPAAFLMMSCSSERRFTQGEYDDVEEVRLLDDKFNESDIAELANEMIKSMAEHPIFKDAKTAPIVQVERVRNKTTEHIDTKNITDSVRTALIKTGRVRFSNKEDRELLGEEIDYQTQSGRVKASKQVKAGEAYGADYVLTGDLISNTQEVGNRKLIFYRLTLNLTNIETGTYRVV